MSHWLGVLLICFLVFQDCIQSLRLVEVRIPNFVIKGSIAQLECIYDLNGDALYSVKWYKDGNEIYRYQPKDMPPAQTFLLPGVLVDLHNSNDAVMTLRNVNLQTSGRFRCEVSGEAPSFQTVTEHGDMVVVVLPDQGPPKITGSQPRYQTGDWLNVNCSAGRAKPAVDLAWYVNGEAAEPKQLRKYANTITGRDELETTTMGLEFRVQQHHLRYGDIKLKCVASISSFYWRSNEESVQGELSQKASILESLYARNSRADPVHSNRVDSISVTRSIGFFTTIIIAIVVLIVGNCLQQLNLCHLCNSTIVEHQKLPQQQFPDELQNGESRNTSRKSRKMCEVSGLYSVGKIFRHSNLLREYLPLMKETTAIANEELFLPLR